MSATDTAPSDPPRTPDQPPPATRLRIAFAAPPWYDVPPEAYGGIESLVADLIDALIGRGHSVFLVGPGTNGTKAEFLRTYEEAMSERIGEAIPEVVHAACVERHLSQLDVNVIHDHSLAGPLTADSRRPPTVVTAHGPVVGEIGTYYRNLSRDIHLVAISDAQRRLCPELNWAGMVHNALNVAQYTFRPDKGDHVLFLGRFSPDKGAHLAIDAARAAGRPIILAGKLQEEHEHAYFDQEVRPRLGEDAEFLGEADLAAKQELYGSAHCLVFPIQWEEPFGMVMIEAMACGTPVVALRCGAVPEVVVDGVTGFIRDEPEELPAAIDAVTGLDPGACRRHVEEHFDAATMAAGYEQIYAAAAAG
jgi:glycosyltransferase involved in cell wall biosynthesis